MLDEDGVTGQVAVDDRRVTGVEVARDAEQSTGQEATEAEASIPFPSSLSQAMSEEDRRAEGTCQRFTIAGRYN